MKKIRIGITVIIFLLISTVIITGIIDHIINRENGNDTMTIDYGIIFYDIGFQINESNGFLFIPLPYYEENSSIIYPPIYMETVNSLYGKMIKINIHRFNALSAFSILFPRHFEIQKIAFESYENNQIKVFSSFSGSVNLAITITSGMTNDDSERQKIVYNSLEYRKLIGNEWINMDLERINENL